MFNSWCLRGCLLALTVFISACGGNSSSDSNKGDGGPSNRVNWAGVPSEFNPQMDLYELHSLSDIQRIYLDIFSFDHDVEVLYSRDLRSTEAHLKIYRVQKGTAYWGNIEPVREGTSLNIKPYGRYQCSIKVTNGQITELEGGCYIRVQLVLPLASEIEVYNLNQLITKRFIPIDTETFLRDLHRATWADDKFAVIDTFLASYPGTGKTPTLTAKQLGIVVDEFSWGDEKLKALRKLHMYVSDRVNLADMIKNKFSYFDQEEARKIVGL